ncbi:MAG: hypothetical protein ACJ8AT_16090 [Hyalangium sp.]|uniref:hypothetical protein n=1 Tax=Hyalangium sp. TaxID=2028555 RepID=UPI00389A26B9
MQVVVLCEGFKDYRFAYKCLVTCGWRRDQIAFNISPSGKESAFTYVLNHYSAEVQANRNGKKKERALFVLIDADKQPEGGRENELAKRLDAAGLKPRQAGERIAFWVPRRHLETWVHFLTRAEATEQADYKDGPHRVKEREYMPAAERFAKILKGRQSLPSGAVPSLKKAVAEFDRLRRVPSKGSKRTMRKR